MPEGLEKDLKPQAVADLISALQEQYPAPKKFPGNTPSRIQPDTAGKLVLSSANCAIYGKSLVLEQPYGNLGMWRGEDDLAVWQVAIPSAGEYQVSIEWACERGTAGNPAQVSTRDGALRFKVESTGTWDQYKTATIGKIRLQAGIQRIRLQPAGPVSQFLIDLRKIILVPLPR